MSKNIRVVSTFILIIFIALFASSTYIQSISATQLQQDPRNIRTALQSYEAQRGPILVGQTAIANSLPSVPRKTYTRIYSNPELYSHITGFFNNTQGSTGIERALNQELSGNADSQFFSQLKRLFTDENPVGGAVELTINPKIQQEAYNLLGDNMGAIVVIDARSGAILAMVSKPSYNTNALSQGTTQSIQKEYAKLTSSQDTPLINRAIEGNLYPPGSTFKLIVTAAALQSGITPTTPLSNPAQWQLPGSTHIIFNPLHGQKCGTGADTTNLQEALKYSCNIPFAQLAVQIGDQKLRSTAKAFGFNSNFSIPIKTAKSTYPQQKLSDAQTALTGFGQFDVRATPLQMALVSSAIANNGTIMQPTLIKQILAPNLEVTSKQRIQKYSEAVSPSIAQTLKNMMQDNVNSGVASNARVPNLTVGGKTGTAETIPGKPPIVWFTGFAQSASQSIALAIAIENGAGQGQNPSSNAITATMASKMFTTILK